jgi:hypothetical protein
MTGKSEKKSPTVFEPKGSLTPWKLPTVYKKEQVDLFWSQTDEKTRE